MVERPLPPIGRPVAERPPGEPRTVRPARPFQRPALDLRIDELVLHGFPATARHAIAVAFERELARLLLEGDAPAGLIDRRVEVGGARRHRLDAGTLVVPHDAPPDVVGVQVARAIHRELSAAPGAGRRGGPAPERGGAAR